MQLLKNFNGFQVAGIQFCVHSSLNHADIEFFNTCMAGCFDTY
jgi:hypothetical protein